MNLQATITVNIIGVFLAVITWVNSHIVRERQSLDDILFSVMLFISGSSCIVEPITFLIDGRVFPGAFLISRVTNTWLYLGSSSISLIWCLFVDHKLYQNTRRLRRVYAPAIAVGVIGWLATLGNVWGNYFFSFDAQNTYHREPYGYIMFALPIIYSDISIITVYKARKEFGDLRFFPVWSFLTPFFLGMGVQTLVYGISVAWCSVSIGLAVLFMSLQNELVYRDPLTGLYNRNYLNYVLKSTGWNRAGRHGGIMIDLDFFKIINDTYGHTSGDNALCDVADLLQACLPEKSLAFRYAGDEFILLFDASEEEEILAVENRIQASLDDFNAQKKRPYHLSLSMGHSCFLPGTHDADSFLTAMDKSMYENKRKHHEAAE